ncbi:FAD-dependent oxidoreductase [Spongiibacter marinus]|uniref:FAD-dependent oxidoreductase n=1 Tax=Spongiibacter marinus TaxID=354246 RepID=UPI0035BE442F
MKKKILLILLLLGAGVLLLNSGLGDYLSLDGLKQARSQVAAFQTAHPAGFFALFFICYVLVTALSLPGAAVMTLAGGAFFGLFQGLLLVSFASTIGATLAFLVARYLLRDSLKRRFPQRLQRIDEGVSKEGGFYLFTLRLVPIFPFFLINLLMGLTAMSARRFYWVSQLGMLPGTAVYVNAGVQLGSLESLSGILSPALLLSFTLLGVFPLIAKRIIAFVKARRVYRGWSRPTSFDRNLVVIGAGAAGLVTSYIASAVKAKVSLIEANEMGGDCLNTGCVPSKALIKSAKVAATARRAEEYGFEEHKPALNLPRLIARVRDVIAAIAPHDSVERYTELGVDVIQGYARIVDPWTVEIRDRDGGSRRLTTRSIVIAAGASPTVPPLPGMAELGFVTSDTLWDHLERCERLPQRVVVLGGGPIGCELSQCFARLGSAVSQVEMLPRLLLKEDEDVADFVTEQLRRDGVDVRCNTRAVRCEMRDGERCLIVQHGDAEGESAVAYDLLICAVGRSARLTGFGLEELGITTDRTVDTNEYLQTLMPNIYAAGDVAGPYQFTHVAAHQAWYASVNALFGQFKKFAVDYSVIPWVTYVDPEVARVGLNEQEAKAQGIDYEVTRYGLDDLDRAICDGNAQGFIKVLTPVNSDRILGVCIVGSQGGDLLAEFVLAMKHKLGLGKILATIHPYPTWAEGNKYLAGEWRKAHQPERILRLLARFFRWQRGG